MQEYIDRNKLQVYFRWFQQHNHLFKDMVLDEDLIENFEKEAQETVERMDLEKNKLITNHSTIKSCPGQIHDEIYNSDEEEDTENVKLAKELVVNDHSSVITNKYVEDTSAPTVANKFSDMIISMEKILSFDNEEAVLTDPEDSYYVEDEIYLSESEDEEEMNEELFSFEEMIHLTTMKKIKKESLQDLYWLNNNSNLQKLCKCGVTKKISSLMESKFKLEKIKVEDINLIAFKNNILKDF